MELPNSFEDFVNTEQPQEEEELSLERRFALERARWTKKIEDMSNKLRKVFDIQELQGTLYTDRQSAVEYNHMITALISKVSRAYRKAYSEKYEHYTFETQRRFPTETAKNNQILADLDDLIEKKEALSNQAKFMENTIKTIDNIIFGVKYRIEIEQISRGR